MCHAPGWLGALVALALAPLLVSCGGGSGQPDPSELNGAIVASEGLNPNAAGEPSPVVIRIYELTDNRKFLSAEFFELFDNDTAFLGEDYLGSTELVIEPGTEIPYTREVSGDTRWVGVIAGFREVETANWRDSIKVEPESRTRFNIQIEPQSIRITKTRNRILGL